MRHLLLFSMLLLLSLLPSCGNRLNMDFGRLNPNDFEIYLIPGTSEYADDNYKEDIVDYDVLPDLIGTGRYGYGETSWIVVYKDGVHYNFPHEYGENDWFVIYKGQQFFRFRHFVTNRRRIHRYNFAFYEEQDTIYCDVDIRGKNDLKDTFHFTDIE